MIPDLSDKPNVFMGIFWVAWLGSLFGLGILNERDERAKQEARWRFDKALERADREN